MQTLIELFQQHPYWGTAILTWLSTQFVSAFVNALPAPTPTSSSFYVFFFRLSLNLLAGNPSRARLPMPENSPNFNAAVQRQFPAVFATAGSLTPPNQTVTAGPSSSSNG